MLEIKPIDEINELFSYKKPDPNTVIIVITTAKYKYNFKPTLILDFKDVSRDEEGFITETHIKKLVSILPTISKAKTVFVGCDAGVSRSPAVALALATYLKQWHDFQEIAVRYPYLNNDVYEFVRERLSKIK